MTILLGRAGVGCGSAILKPRLRQSSFVRSQKQYLSHAARRFSFCYGGRYDSAVLLFGGFAAVILFLADLLLNYRGSLPSARS
jgi:hypothetical protein